MASNVTLVDGQVYLESINLSFMLMAHVMIKVSQNLTLVSMFLVVHVWLDSCK